MRRRSKQFARRHRIVSAVLLGVCIFLLQTVLTVAVLSHEPGFAAHSADVLRGIIGDENVARLETFVLGWQDTYQSWVYHAGGDPPQAPFASPTPGPVTVALIITPTPTPIPADTNGSPVLTATSLHYELGTLEPAAYDPLAPIERPGRIPSYDPNSELVVAAFNGGFRAKHGQFGVMVNGTVIIGPAPI